MSDLKTGREAVEPCQFEPEVCLQRQVRSRRSERGQKATVEAKKYSTIEAGESLHGVALISPSTAETSLQNARHILARCPCMYVRLICQPAVSHCCFYEVTRGEARHYQSFFCMSTTLLTSFAWERSPAAVVKA